MNKGLINHFVNRRRTEHHREREQAKEQTRQARLANLEVRPLDLIEDLERFFSERAYLPDGAALVLAMWVLITWTFNLFDTTPYLSLESAVPGCGKTTILRLLTALCARPEMTISMSEAVLFRIVEERQPTLLVDEAESLEGRSERAEAIRCVALAGYTKDGIVNRCEGDNHAIRGFKVYCPKAFAAIGGLSGALLDRCIVVHMEKAPRGYTRKSTRRRALKSATEPLRERIEAYCIQSESALLKLYEVEPDEGYWPGINDREAELWGPLLIHLRTYGTGSDQPRPEIRHAQRR